MHRLTITAEVEDAAEWEKSFRTHGELFKEQTATAVYFNVTDNNEVAVHFEIDDLEKFLEILESPVTEESMGSDGVKKETVKVYILDSEFVL